MWLVFANTNRIRNKKLKLLAKPVALVIIVIGVGVGLPLASRFSDRYDIEKAIETAEITANYIHRISLRDQGSAYNLNIEYTPLGIVRAAPAAVNVTLFRPYLWEVRNPVMLLAAVEGTAFLFVTLYLFFRIGLLNFFRFLFNNPFLLASFVFSLTFAFAVGATTFNFGSLVRYKIPCLPFYGLVLAVAYGEYRRLSTARNQARFQVRSH
ncbi:MAG: hypothetical protein D6772_14060 [Bacteroidetes bacterium]|nr:MAG: hypothetical protein D6772_14060 [Bacteroidota bacterium]